MLPSDGEGGAARLLAPLRSAFVPNRFVTRVTEGDDLAAHAVWVPVVKAKRARQGKATAYVCYDQVCRRPTTEPSVFGDQLAAVEPLPGKARTQLEEVSPSR